MATTWICPECATGKHINCDGTAWDGDTDQPTTCGCTHPLTVASGDTIAFTSHQTINLDS